jgi:hypothetical protein
MAEDIRDRLARVRERIARAAQLAGRQPEQITLIAVSKTFDPATIQKAVDAGVTDLGENRVQEAESKIGFVAGQNLRWHMIGHLQSNKARRAASIFSVIHSIDSIRIAQRLDQAAQLLGRKIPVLIELNLAREPNKSGADESELSGIVEALDRAQNLQLRGLMAIPPFLESPEMVRPYFRRLRQLLEELNRSRPPEKQLTELSMGMSHDFEVAIQEGATMVRIGTAIFGPRPTER